MKPILLRLLSIIALGALGAPAFAQENAEPVEYSLEQDQKLTRTFLSLGQGKKLEVPADESERGIFVIAKGAHIGRRRHGSFGARTYLVCSLRLANLTNEPFEFLPASMRLTVDGQELKHEPWTGSSRLSDVRIAGDRLDKIETPSEVKLNSGEVKEVHGVFLNLPLAGVVGKLQLLVGGLPQPVRIDLMAKEEKALKLVSERMGPRQCLGVLTINGRIGPVNANCVVREIENLLDAGASRFLIRWGRNAVVPQPSATSWMKNAATYIEKGSVHRSTNGFPAVPQGIVELHLSPFPATRVSDRNKYANGRLYATSEAAFVGALQTAYARLPVVELVRSIEQGTPLFRAAAIAGGIGRLPEQLVPQLIEFSASKEPTLQRHAAVALSAFPSEAAMNRIVELVRTGDKNLVTQAVQGLQNSRFPIAQTTLQNLLETLEPKARLLVVGELIAHPRAEWRELYYEFASAKDDSSTQTRALGAIIQTGHPKLRQLLRELLDSKNITLRTRAFGELSKGRDPQSLAIAQAYTMESLEEDFPSVPMLDFLGRQGVIEATPLLIKHYLDPGANRRRNPELLRKIIALGDESIIPFLMEQYSGSSPALEWQQKTQILTALSAFRVPGLTNMAIEALEDPRLVRTASQILQDDPTPEVVQALADKVVSIGPGQEGSIIQALQAIATPQARRTLRVLQNGKSPALRTKAAGALGAIRDSSPAGWDLNLARQHVDAGRLDEAEKQFARALQIDPFLAEIYVARGHMKGRDNRRDEGVVDYDLALQVDPLHPIATSLKAICVVVLGDVDGGLKMIEDNRETFRYDSLFHYNAACAYGQAIKVTDATSDNLKRIAEWKLKSLEYLERDINELGGNPGLLPDDPDLDPLREMDRFKKLVEKAKPDEEPAEDDG